MPSLVAPVRLTTARANWEIIKTHFPHLDERTAQNKGALVATILVETASRFFPLKEFGNLAYFREHYWDNKEVRRELGNMIEADSWTYCGRGYIQLTGRANYEKIGWKLKLDLIKNPDLLLEPKTSAAALKVYWDDHGLTQLANRNCDITDQAERDKNWIEIRKRVNGGTHGLQQYLYYLTKLGIR